MVDLLGFMFLILALTVAIAYIRASIRERKAHKGECIKCPPVDDKTTERVKQVWHDRCAVYPRLPMPPENEDVPGVWG